jgi:signal transduction histidine kinase
VPVDLAIEGEQTALPPGLDVTAYRIVEEALTDVLRRSGPAHPAGAHVRVRYAARELELEVTDEAGGASAAGRADDGDGRFGLRERVAMFGGELQTGRRRGGPWTLRARLPVEREPVA